MASHYEPRRLVLVRIFVIFLLVVSLLAYIVVGILRLINPAIVLVTKQEAILMNPPILIVEGSRAVFADSNIELFGIYLDKTGREASVSLGKTGLEPITYGGQIKNQLPASLNDQLNAENTVWWLRSQNRWKMGAKKDFDGKTFTALRLGVKPSNGGGVLSMRLLAPTSTNTDFLNAVLRPLGTALRGTMSEIRYIEKEVQLLDNSNSVIQYDAQQLGWPVPNNDYDFWIQLRPGNTLDANGMFIRSNEVNQKAVTWYDIVSGAGGLSGLLLGIYAFLFGASPLRTWGPMQHIMRDEIINGSKPPENMRTKEAGERISDLESFKHRMDAFYLEHGLFDGNKKWYKFW